MPNKRSPKKLNKRTSKKLSKKKSKKTNLVGNLRQQNGGKPIFLSNIVNNLSLAALQRKTTRLFNLLPIPHETKNIVKAEIRKYERLVKDTIEEYNQFMADKVSKKGVKALKCFNERSSECLNKSCDISGCTNRYSENLFELTGGESNGGIKRCFDHWKIGCYITLMKTFNDYAHYYYQRRVASMILGSQEKHNWDSHSWDETIASTMVSILSTVSQKIITKYNNSKISNAGKKIHKERAKRKAEAKRVANARRALVSQKKTKKSQRKKKSQKR